MDYLPPQAVRTPHPRPEDDEGTDLIEIRYTQWRAPSRSIGMMTLAEARALHECMTLALRDEVQ